MLSIVALKAGCFDGHEETMIESSSECECTLADWPLLMPGTIEYDAFAVGSERRLGRRVLNVVRVVL